MNADRAALAALAGVEKMTVSRLRSLVRTRSPTSAYGQLVGDRALDVDVAELFRRNVGLRETWRASAQRRAPDEIGARCNQIGVRVVTPDDDDYPAQLLDDPRRPEVLFAQGDLNVLDARRVGIVGTRNPTQAGRQTAARFGHELAAHGVVVVSGLALGVDAAAHSGALASEGAPVVAVVANGHDRPYPRRNSELWRRVADRGVVLSEWPPGTPPDAFRFPLRNRILAALSEVVVVVESRERGGSLITAREAIDRSIDVFAVPGSLDNRAAAGTNLLLRDGAAPATEPADILATLGIDQRRAGRARFDTRPAPTTDERPVLERCRRGPVTLEIIGTELGLDIAQAAMVLARLERSGWLCETGGWFQLLDEWAELV